MIFKLFLIFTLIPFVEIYLLIKIGSHLGAFNTVVIVIITGLLGAYLAKMEGLQTMIRLREALMRGETPAGQIFDALLILIAGIVLITPGFLTDIAGILILIPQTRLILKKWLRKKCDEWVTKRQVNIRLYP